MSISTHAPSTTTPSTETPRTGGLLPKLGGVCIAVAPVVFGLGLLTAPHQDEATRESYVSSLADHPTQAAMSANFLHYSWLLFVFGLIAVIGLVQGRRGRAFTSITAVAGVVSAIQISGLLMFDFFVIELGNRYGAAETAALQDDLGTSVLVWLITGQLALLFIPLTFLGLARARAISWWIAPLPLLGFVVGGVGLPAAISTVATLACWAPAYVAGYRLVTGTRRVVKTKVTA